MLKKCAPSPGARHGTDQEGRQRRRVAQRAAHQAATHEAHDLIARAAAEDFGQPATARERLRRDAPALGPRPRQGEGAVGAVARHRSAVDLVELGHQLHLDGGHGKGLENELDGQRHPCRRAELLGAGEGPCRPADQGAGARRVADELAGEGGPRETVVMRLQGGHVAHGDVGSHVDGRLGQPPSAGDRTLACRAHRRRRHAHERGHGPTIELTSRDLSERFRELGDLSGIAHSSLLTRSSGPLPWRRCGGRSPSGC